MAGAGGKPGSQRPQDTAEGTRRLSGKGRGPSRARPSTGSGELPSWRARAMVLPGACRTGREGRRQPASAGVTRAPQYTPPTGSTGTSTPAHDNEYTQGRGGTHHAHWAQMEVCVMVTQDTHPPRDPGLRRGSLPNTCWWAHRRDRGAQAGSHSKFKSSHRTQMPGV